MTHLKTGSPRAFRIEVEEDVLADLKTRLSQTRWPEKETVEDWSQGVPLQVLQSIARYWAEHYDWRRCESRINALGSQLIEVDGLDIHFLHVRSDHPSARPLILTHGWPGSIVEFIDLIPMLTDPVAYGGEASDAFHVVVPSIPGFGFSGKPDRTGWKIERIADAWAALMTTLGYREYVAQGGDWGAAITSLLGSRHPEACKAVHINLVVAKPDKTIMETPTAEEAQSLIRARKFQQEGTGYSTQQSTRPQTLGYGLTDSPVGQAAWILEKFFEWTDNDGTLESVGSLDHLLDNVMMYWVTAAAVSSARLYWEGYAGDRLAPVTTPVGCTVFPEEINTPSRRWAETRYKNIFYWNEVAEGGHFAALEQPRVLLAEIHKCFRDVKVHS